MIIETKETRWVFTAEGDDRDFMHRLHDIDECQYKDWVAARDAIFDDDPDAGIIGSLAVYHTSDLLNLLKAAVESGIAHHISCYVGDYKNGSSSALYHYAIDPEVALGPTLVVDVEAVNGPLGTAMKEIREITGRAIYGGNHESR